MGLFSKKKDDGSIISEYFKLLEPIGQFSPGMAIKVTVYSDHLLFSYPLIKTPISLALDKITGLYYGTQAEVEESDASPIGRAIVGSLLFGETGAVVGAVSGTQKKKKKVYHKYFIISYTSDGIDDYLAFEDTRRYRGKKVAAAIRELCHLSDPQEKKIITDL